MTPIVIERSGDGHERAYDIYSRLMKERVIFIHGNITGDVATVVCAQLLFLEHLDREKDIQLYISSPGGHIHAGLAIYDTMNFVRPDISTTCIGHAMSMGAVLLAAGAKGKRYSLPNARILIHQPSVCGIGGDATDVDLHARELLESKRRLSELMATLTGKTYAEIINDTERDRFMSPVDAIEYGIIDEILVHRA